MSFYYQPGVPSDKQGVYGGQVSGPMAGQLGYPQQSSLQAAQYAQHASQLAAPNPTYPATSYAASLGQSPYAAVSAGLYQPSPLQYHQAAAASYGQSQAAALQGNPYLGSGNQSSPFTASRLPVTTSTYPGTTYSMGGNMYGYTSYSTPAPTVTTPSGYAAQTMPGYGSAPLHAPLSTPLSTYPNLTPAQGSMGPATAYPGAPLFGRPLP